MTIALALTVNMLATDTAMAENDLCQVDAMMAEMFMQHRQMPGGWSLARLMQGFSSEPGIAELILETFEYPLMLTPETRVIAVEEFTDQITLRCYRDGPVRLLSDE
jgi:hypothetical protein